MFRAFQDKGFHISFDNGLTVAVMFGTGNYCEHRDAMYPSNSSVDAELLVFRTEIAEHEHSHEYVFADGCNGTGYCGWVSPEGIAKAIAIVGGYRQDEPIGELVSALQLALKGK